MKLGREQLAGVEGKVVLVREQKVLFLVVGVGVSWLLFFVFVLGGSRNVCLGG